MTELRILVTGGAGFVGSHLCERLLGQGHQVVALDNFQTSSRRNADALAANSRFSLVEHDVVHALPALGARFDQIFNLACPASPPLYQRDPVHTTLTNVLGMKHVLDLAERDGARVFQASTSEVYGDPEVHPQPESYRGAVSTIGPRACYDEGKRVAESLCFDYHRTRGVEIRVARIFNTYGPRMDPRDGRVVSNFIMQALRGEPLTIYGEGSQTRSFCYVDDLVDGFLALMSSEVSGPVNLGTEHEMTVKELAELIIELTESRSELVKEPLPQDDPTQRRPDLSLARAQLGFEPRVSVRDGLTQTIEYFRAHLSAHPEAS